MLEVSAVRLHACTKTLAPLVNCIVNDALVGITLHLLQTLFQFVSVVHSQLVYSPLEDAPDPVILFAGQRYGGMNDVTLRYDYVNLSYRIVS